MKKIFLMAVMAVGALSASAQIESGSRWGMTVPMGMSSYTDVSGAGNVVTFGYEVVYEYNFSKNFYIGSGIGISTRGSKIDRYQGLTVNGKLQTFNVIVPANIGTRIMLSDNSAFFIQGGVYGSVIVKPAAIDFSGYTVEGEDFDWGLSGRAGIEVSRIQFFGGYEYGMYDVWDSSKNNTIVFGIGYMF